MDREIILASHGKFASGILDSLELIYGKNHSITALDCYTDENFDLTESVSQLFMRYKDKEIIVLTDLLAEVSTMNSYNISIRIMSILLPD